MCIDSSDWLAQVLCGKIDVPDSLLGEATIAKRNSKLAWIEPASLPLGVRALKTSTSKRG